MTNIISRIRNRIAHGPLGEGRFVRNVLTILAGTAFSQAISLAVMPILARLFDPEDFGLLATFTAVANMLAMFACLSYQGAIILPRRHEAAFTLWAACSGLTMLMSLLTGVLLFVFAEPLVGWLGNPALSAWLWLVPVSVAAWGIFEATSLWATRKKAFADLSSAMVQKRLALSGSQLVLGLNEGTRTSGGLIVGQVIGELTGVIVLVRKALRGVPRNYWEAVRWRRIKVLLHRYRRFPIYDLASSFAAALARAMPVIVLGIYFSPAIVGFFAMANRLVAAPMQLGITSITRVFFERANRAKLDGNLAVLTAEVYSRLCIILLTPLALLAIAAPELITILLGAQWEESGHYLRWLCLWFFFVSTASPLHRLFAVLERQDELAIINGILFVVSTGALIAGGMLDNARLTLALFAMSSSLVWFAQGVRVLHIAGVKLATLAGILSVEILRSVPFIAVLLAAQVWLDNAFAVSTCLLIVGAGFAIIRLRRIFSLAPGSLTRNN